ncbi:MAG TPA: hypothetical protein VGC42_22030 [Kofleriaceae bacterium]
MAGPAVSHVLARRLGRLVLCVGTAAALAASAPAEAKGPAGAPPPELLVTVAIGPASTLRGLQAYVEAVKPNTGALVSEPIIRHQLAAAAGVPSLDGLDAGSWTYVLVSDHNSSMAITVAGKVRDAKALTAAVGADHLTIKDGWAVVGERANVDRDAAFALATLVTQPAPKQLTATVYLPQLLARYQQQLHQVRNQVASSMPRSSAQMATIVNAYVDGIASLGADTDKLIVTLDAAADLGSLDVALVPRAGSRLAQFVAAQKPTDYALLGKLPPLQPSMVMAGGIDLGPYHDGMLQTMAAFLDPTGSKEVLAALEQLRKTMTGEVAFTLQMAPGAGLQMAQLFGTSDAKVADASLASMLALFRTGRSFEVQGAKTTIQSTATPTTYDGVTIRGYDTTMDLTKAEPAQRQMATLMGSDKPVHAQVAAFDKLAMVVATKDSQADAHRAIDTARGKAAAYAPSPEIKAQLDASRARKDSMAMVFDVGKLVAAFLPAATLGNLPVVISLGTADKQAHLRFVLPASLLRGLASLRP